MGNFSSFPDSMDVSISFHIIITNTCIIVDYEFRVCQKLRLGDFKFHDLRKTFGSILAQNGISTALTQKLLEHSSSTLTNKVHTNVDPVLYQS